MTHRHDSGGEMRGRALATALGVLGTSVLFAAPAEACSCMRQNVREALREGTAVAVVTRTDHGTATSATLRVDAALGADLPATLTGEVDGGMDCQPSVFPDQVAALIVERRPAGGWVVGSCSAVDLGDALDRIHGVPVAASGGPVVAVAHGDFGGSRLAGLDRDGRVVAWDGRPGEAEAMTLCPGRRTIVAYSLPRTWEPGHLGEVTVHDAATLRLKRAVRLPPAGQDAWLAGLRCADADGDVVQAIVTSYGNRADPARLLTVDGTRVESVAIQPFVDGLVPVADGFLGYEDRSDASRVVRIGLDGTRTSLPMPADLEAIGSFTVAVDGVTVAAVGHTPRPEYSPEPSESWVFVFDARSGKERARWQSDEGPGGMAWTASGNLLVRVGFANSYGVYSEGTVVTLDRRLRELSRGSAGPGGGLAAVGETAVAFGGTRVTATPKGGETRVLAEPRLAAARSIRAVSDVGLEPAEEAPPIGGGGVVRAVRWTTPATTDGPARGVLVCLAAAVLAIVLSRVRQRQ